MNSINTSSEHKDIKKNKSFREKRNIFGRIFLGYQSCENRFYSSALYKLFSFFKNKMSWVGRLKHSIADKTEDSILCSFFSSLLNDLLAFPLRSYGIMMFFFGLVTLLVEIFRLSANFSILNGSVIRTIFNLILIFSISALLTVSSKSLGKVLVGSSLFSKLLFSTLNFDLKKLSVETKTPNNILFVVFGCILGIVSIFIRSQFILLLSVALIVLYIVMKNPESGIILTFLMLPFLRESLLVGFAAMVCLSVFFKVIRNKRVMKFELPDLFAFLLLLVIFFSGFNGISHMGSLVSAFRITVIFVFGWVVNNTVKTTVLAEKCVNAFVFSVSILSVIGIILFLFDIYDLESKNKIFEILGSILRKLPFSSAASFVQLVVLAVPFAFSSYKRVGFKGILSSLLCVVFLILSCDVSSWISLITSIILYFSIMSPILFLYFGVVISLLIGIYNFFPEIFSVVGNFIMSITNYSEYIGGFSSSAKYGTTAIKEFMFSGSGVGQNTIDHVFKCLFGYGNDIVSGDCFMYVQMILQIGFVGIVLCFFIYCLVVSNCLSLYCKDKICKESLRGYVLSCLTACGTVFFAGFFTFGSVSSNIMMFTILIIYLSFSFRKCSEIEFTPEAYDIESYEDVV